MSMGEPHAHMRESTESLSASSLILLLQVLLLCESSVSSLIQSFPSSYGMFSPSFRIHSIVILIDHLEHESACGDPMSIEESHEHGRTTCAYKGVNGVTFRFIAHSSASGSSSAL